MKKDAQFLESRGWQVIRTICRRGMYIRIWWHKPGKTDVMTQTQALQHERLYGQPKRKKTA